MGWKNRPYWLRGGIYLAIVFTIYLIIERILYYSLELVWKDPYCAGGVICTILYFSVGILHLFPVNLRSHVITIIIGYIFFLVVGAIIGLIVGKIKSRKENKNIEEIQNDTFI